jgi:hypothetical protein
MASKTSTTEVITTDATDQATIDANNVSQRQSPTTDSAEKAAEIVAGVLLPGVTFVKGAKPKLASRGKAAKEFTPDAAIVAVLNQILADPEGSFPIWNGTNKSFRDTFQRSYAAWKDAQHKEAKKVVSVKFEVTADSPNKRSAAADDSDKLIQVVFYITNVNAETFNKD